MFIDVVACNTKKGNMGDVPVIFTFPTSALMPPLSSYTPLHLLHSTLRRTISIAISNPYRICNWLDAILGTKMHTNSHNFLTPTLHNSLPNF